MIVIVRLLTRKRVSPEELERQRRLFVHRNGRLLDGYIVEIDGDVIHFEYSVNGVDYQATQDIAAVRHLLPAETYWAIGPVTLKYVNKNPANSIVICEDWSGLRERTRA